MGKNILITEQQFDGLLTDILGWAIKGFPEDKKNDNNSNNSSSSLTNITPQGQELLDNPVFKEKLEEISEAININKDSIIKLMQHESRLNPTIKNNIGCVGLIQFCPVNGRSIVTANGNTYSFDDIRNNLELQMDAIKDFWVKGYRSGKIKSPSDLYIYNFFPIAAGKSNDFVLQSQDLSATEVARANPIFNRTLGKPKDSPLTVGDLKDYYRQTGMV